MPKHIKPSDLPNPKHGEVVRHTVTLEKGDTAWMPGTTKHVYKGPKKLTYLIYSFDRVDVEVNPIDDAGTVSVDIHAVDDAIADLHAIAAEYADGRISELTNVLAKNLKRL